jgi:hypothetical protein
LKQRYKKVDPTSDPSPGQATSQNSDAAPDAPPALLKGRHVWTTEEGTVVVEEQGDTVFVSESLDTATTATLEKEVFATATSSSTAK